mgnify:CR=1 FL=1|jgi:D-alanyl-D-alanine carboxypeptidase (penicillin-binding protein 5/6)
MKKLNNIELNKTKKRLIFLALLLIVISLIGFWLLKPNNKLKVLLTIKNINVPGKLILEIPKNDKIYAIGTLNDGILIEHEANKEWPLASLTKMMTAYIVLKDHPLKEGAEGPRINITQKDVEEYEKFKKEGQSIAKVANNESLSERKLVEGMLIPSANNFAYILARWDSGNVKNFVRKMNKTAVFLGLKNTHYVGPAGAKAQNISTALNQFTLAKKVMEIKVFKHIVAMPQTYIPKEGIVYNVNYDLGKDGIEGIKTGTSSRTLGNFIFYAVKHNIHMLGALLGVSGKEPLMDALKDAKYIIKQFSGELFKRNIVKKDEEVDLLEINNKKAKLIATKSLFITEYPGLKINFSIPIKHHLKFPVNPNQKNGYLEISFNGIKSKFQ